MSPDHDQMDVIGHQHIRDQSQTITHGSEHHAFQKREAVAPIAKDILSVHPSCDEMVEPPLFITTRTTGHDGGA